MLTDSPSQLLPARFVWVAHLAAAITLLWIAGINLEARPIDDLVEKGRMQMLDARLDDAEATFRLILDQYDAPEDMSRGYYHLALIAHWKAMFEQSDVFYREHDKASDLLLREIRYLEEKDWKLYYSAEIHIQKTLIAVQRKDFGGAARAARRAFREYKECLDLNPDFVEAKKGLGFLRLGVGSVPSSYRWVLSIFGFEGSVTEGLDNMREAAEKSSFGIEEAQIYFAFADLVLNDGEGSGIEYLRELETAYPASPIFGTLYAFGLLKTQRADEAGAVLQRIENSVPRESRFFPSLFDYYLGDAQFRNNNFSSAITSYQRFLGRFTGSNLKASAMLKTGIAYEMGGDRRRAVDVFRQIQPGSEYDSDEQAVRMAADRMRMSLSESERTLLLAQNHFDAGRFVQAVQAAEPLWREASEMESVRLEAAYRVGRAHQALGHFDFAIEAFSWVVENKVDDSSKWAPWSQLYIGNCLEHLGKNEEALSAYRSSLQYRGKFDFNKGHEQQARTAIARIR